MMLPTLRARLLPVFFRVEGVTTRAVELVHARVVQQPT